MEGNRGTSQLSSSSKPSLFLPSLSRPASKKALSALLGQFHPAAGQKCPGDPPSLAGWCSHPFPTPTPSWRDFPLPACILPPNCKEACRGHFFGYGEGVFPGLVVWGRMESPSDHCLMVPPFPAAEVVVSPLMFSVSRPGATAG